MRKILCLILCIVILAMGVMSASAAPAKKVAFICKAYSDAFCVWVKDEMVRVAKEKYANDFVFAAFDAENNSTKQIDQINNAVANKFDVIMFQQVDIQSTVGAVKDAIAKGVQVIVITGHIEDGGASKYIDSSPEAQGKLLGEFAIKNLPKNAKVAILQGPAGNLHANGRDQGIKTALASRKDIKIIDQQIGEWAKEKGLTITQNWLSSIKDLNGILAHNDNMALGAMEAIKMAGKEGKIQIYGVDGMAEAVLAVKDGKMMATVFQNAIAYAEKGLEFASKAVKGQNIENMWLDSDLITKANVAKYIELHKKLGNIK